MISYFGVWSLRWCPRVGPSGRFSPWLVDDIFLCPQVTVPCASVSWSLCVRTESCWIRVHADPFIFASMISFSTPFLNAVSSWGFESENVDIWAFGRKHAATAVCYPLPMTIFTAGVRGAWLQLSLPYLDAMYACTLQCPANAPSYL